jgi:dolichol-phosphate mannosyltransferase
MSDPDNKMVDFMRADYWMITRQVAEAINACPERNTALFGLIHWLGFKHTTIEYDRRPRLRGTSKWKIKSRIHVAIDWIVAFSGLPLKMVTLIGLATFSLGVLYAVVVIINYLFGQPVLGWSSIMIAVLILGGLQMAILGVIGEYLWRTIDEVRRRPLYNIEKDTSQENERLN